MTKRITLSLTWHVMTVAIVLVILILAGISFGGYKLYSKILATEKAQKEILLAQNEEKLAQDQKAEELILLQQSTLEKTQEELNIAKTEAQRNASQLKTISQTLKDQSAVPKEIIISSSDLSTYTTGVVQVICVIGNNISSGSGTLWTFKDVPHAVVTNYHVVKGADRCVASINNNANANTGIFNLGSSIYTFNKNTDAAILTIGSQISGSTNVANYNYSLSKLRKCSNLMPVGTPVVIIGYPAYAKRDTNMDIATLGTVNVIYRTATNGIISGYDTSLPGLANYFVSAKIDAGNSGGMALAKDAGGICSLGLPTWLTVGNYETQGLVQNILNVLPVD